MRPLLQEPNWVSTGAAAHALGVSRATVRRWCEAGLIAARQLPSGRWQVQRESVAGAVARMAARSKPAEAHT